jgi:hypothetical protein
VGNDPRIIHPASHPDLATLTPFPHHDAAASAAADVVELVEVGDVGGAGWSG